MKKKGDTIAIGTHTSIAGWIEKSFERSAAVGGTTLQIFAQSPRWRAITHYTEDQYQQCRQYRSAYHQTAGLVHSNYLANLSKPFDQCTNDIAGILHDFEVAHATWFVAVNVHIGKGKDRVNRDEAFANMTKNVEYILQKNKEAWITTQFVFENTAGQWSELGSTIEELWYFYRNYLKDLPIKFCIDTAHCRWWGIDLRDSKQFFEQFEQYIWLDQIFCFHLNDARVECGSKLDRHASLGRGAIGWPTLLPYIERAYVNNKICYIETPDDTLWADEITKVRQIVDGQIERIDNFHHQHFRSQLLKKFQNNTSLFG